MSINIERHNIWYRYVYSFEPIPDKIRLYLRGYSHRERWARTRWYLFMNTGAKKAKEDSGSIITPIGRELFIDLGWITQIFRTLEQSNKAATYDSRVASSWRNSNAVIEIYHGGKTPGSVLCGLVYAHGCALLVCICVYEAKKNPGGRTGYPENHWDPLFVSPKCGKRMGLTGFPDSSLRRLNLK
jgi:hypothetical protein